MVASSAASPLADGRNGVQLTAESSSQPAGLDIVTPACRDQRSAQALELTESSIASSYRWAILLLQVEFN